MPQSIRNAALLIIFALSACSVFERADIAESIAAGYLTIETLADAAIAADLTLEDRQRISAQLQQAKNALDSATELYAVGMESEAESRIEQAREWLSAVREIISAQQ